MITLPASVGFSWVFFVTVPCIPANIGYFLFGQCASQDITFNELSSFQLALRLLSPALFAWIFLFTFSTCILEYFPLTGVTCHCLINYVEIQRKNLRALKRNNITAFMRTWREIQIMVGAYNSIHQGRLSSCTTALLSFVAVISLYRIFSVSKSLTPDVGMFILLAVDTTLLIVEVDGYFKGGVFVKSKALVQAMKSNNKVYGQVLGRRYLKSMQALKIYVGSDNFYDQLIALSMLNFNVQQTVTLLLL